MNDDRKLTAYPLVWPTGWARSKVRGRAAFGDHSMARAVREVLAELLKLGVPDWSVVISSNVELRLDGTPRSDRRPNGDAGVAVWFVIGKDKERKVLACDRWDRPEHNLWAIAKHICAVRGQERWGVGTVEQAFRGYTALPDPARKMNPREIMGIAPGPLTVDALEARFRELVKVQHPDHGGDAARFAQIVEARKMLLVELQGATVAASFGQTAPRQSEGG